MDITTGVKQKPYKLLIYGTSGIGKSTFANRALKPFVLQTEESHEELGTPRSPLAKTFDEFIEYGTWLLKNEHDFKTIIIDSLDWLEELASQSVVTDYGVESITDTAFAYGKGNRLVADKMKRIEKMCDLLVDKGLNVMLVAHADIKRYDDPRNDGYDRYEPKLNKQTAAIWTEWSHGVLFANQEATTVEKKGAIGDKTRAVDTTERLLYTVEQPAYKAKNRWNLPPKIILSFKEFDKHYQAFYAKGETK